VRRWTLSGAFSSLHTEKCEPLLTRRGFVIFCNYSEYNYAMNSAGECELLPGAEPLSSDETCTGDQEFWYERTAYRKIPYSTCEGGLRWHEGKAHRCPGLKGHGFFFWVSVLVFPSGLAALVGYWYYRRAGIARG
jgi:hypothetical protein